MRIYELETGMGSGWRTSEGEAQMDPGAIGSGWDARELEEAKRSWTREAGKAEAAEDGLRPTRMEANKAEAIEDVRGIGREETVRAEAGIRRPEANWDRSGKIGSLEAAKIEREVEGRLAESSHSSVGGTRARRWERPIRGRSGAMSGVGADLGA